MTLPFAFVFIGIFLIVAIVLVIRGTSGKKEVRKDSSSRSKSPQGPVDTSKMEQAMKKPLKNKK